ncbi:MAG: hypothetical protein RIR12_303 [Bacteroidota bacterium]|jgi:uncharacterized RDD family membrane protein YckC
MAVIKIPTNFNIELEFEIPAFFKRILALMIDMFVQFIYLKIASEIYESVSHQNDPLDGIGKMLLLPIMLYHVVLEITVNGQSIGKKIMGLRVVDERGGRPSISQFLIRWLLRLSDLWIVMLAFYVIEIIAVLGSGAGFEATMIILCALAFLITDIVLVVSSKKGQRLGDILAKTILISTRTKSNINDTVFQEVADDYIPSFPQIMQLSDRDMNAVKSILAAARKRDDYPAAEEAAAKIKAHLKIESRLDAFDFLEVLLKDYNYLSVK